MDIEKQKIVQELDEYIATCKTRLKNILSALNWSEDDTIKPSTSNSLPQEPRENKDDPSLPESFDCMHSIVIGEDQLKLILKDDIVSIPKKFSDIQLNFNREQKRELYDYVIYNTGKISEPELKVSGSNDNPSGNDMTFAEIVAKANKKDKKLKRKYRTSKPTHTEEVRNLVHLQMRALAQYFNPNSSTPESGHRQCIGNEDHRNDGWTHQSIQSHSREQGKSSQLRRKSRSRSRDGKRKNIQNRIRRERKCEQSRSANRRSRSRDAKNESYHRKSRSKERFRRRTHSRSLKIPASHDDRQKQSASHGELKHKSPSTNKKRKHSRSHSRSHHKSSKSKKSKHSHRELKIKKEIKEERE